MSEDLHYLPEHKSVIDELLLAVPFVKEGKAFGHPAYKVKGKVFCFVGVDGIAIKLPENRVNELLGTDPLFSPFQPVEGLTWKAWLSIEPSDPQAYHQYRELLDESIQYLLDS